MKVSVVMATYNGEKYLCQQLDTIRLQTIRVDELIICDDCSSDRTVEIAQEYINQHALQNEWRVIINDNNMGYANNFNKVSMLASGEYIFFADQDDLWKHDKIKKMLQTMDNHSECMVLCTDYDILYDGENTTKASQKQLSKMPNNGDIERINLTNRSIYIGAIGCCMCVRRSFYHQIEKYWFAGWAQDDRMWKLAQCVDGCFLLHSNLIQHRIHDHNTATYGKYHTINKRVELFTNMLNADMIMEKMLIDTGRDKKLIDILTKHIRMMEYRTNLLKNRKITACFPLIAYLKYYQEIKSYLVEMYMVFRNKH